MKSCTYAFFCTSFYLTLLFCRQITHLETLLLSMERAFNLQEEVLALSAATASKENADTSGHVMPRSHKEMTDAYSTLLSLWRRKALQSVVLRRTMENEYKKLECDFIRSRCVASEHLINTYIFETQFFSTHIHRSDLATRLKEKEIHLEAQRQRSLAVMSENSDLRLQLSSFDGRQAALVQKAASLQDAVQRNKQDTHLMRLMFEEYRSQFDKNMVVIGQSMVQVWFIPVRIYLYIRFMLHACVPLRHHVDCN
jgi:hypothetical protein